jgi:hypothetical protein
LTNHGSDALGLARGEGMQIALLNDAILELAKDRFRKGFQFVTFEEIQQRDAELLLIGSLDNSQIRTQGRFLMRFQVIEQV